MPDPSVLVKPAECRESVWKMAPGPERANLRSVTPSGFAEAVFQANATYFKILESSGVDGGSREMPETDKPANEKIDRFGKLLSYE